MKDNPAQIIFHKRATVALDALSLEDRKSLLKAINHLAIFGIDSVIGKDVKKIKVDESLYLLKVNPGFRIIFRLTDRDEIEILDIVMKERLELFTASQS